MDKIAENEKLYSHCSVPREVSLNGNARENGNNLGRVGKRLPQQIKSAGMGLFTLEVVVQSHLPPHCVQTKRIVIFINRNISPAYLSIQCYFVFVISLCVYSSCLMR